MTQIHDASPQISVRLYKTISRKSVDGETVVSARFAGSSDYIDLTPYLNDRSSVRTSKSVRDGAGGFSITFADAAQSEFSAALVYISATQLESLYGLIEPMDLVEIRMWHGMGPAPLKLPIIMRGFVSEVTRGQAMGGDGRPMRQVTVSGQDFGKIWQMYQVIYLAAYAEGKALLTTFGLAELFGIAVTNAMPAGEFVRTMIEKIINPYLEKMLPTHWADVPTKIETGESISVKHGTVGISFQQAQGSIYDILRYHGDVGVWNELYTEDREDGVHCVYRSVPAMHLTAPEGKSDMIMDDATDPVFVRVDDDFILSLSVTRTDANVANFYWVEAAKFDLISDMQRKLASIPQNDASTTLKDYPNSDATYYGLRPMYGATHQAGDDVKNQNSGETTEATDTRETKQVAWIDKRRKQMMDLNKDNVVFERGSLRVKGGLTRADGATVVKAGDYVQIVTGRLSFIAYVVSVEHEFQAFNAFTSTIVFERGTGFAERVQLNSGVASPWTLEQATRGGMVILPPIFRGNKS